MTPDYEYQQTTSNLKPQSKQEFRQPKQKSPDEVGCCWKKLNSNGLEYLSLKIEINGIEYNLKGFLNSGKAHESDSRPDFILYKSKNIKKEINGNK